MIETIELDGADADVICYPVLLRKHKATPGYWHGVSMSLYGPRGGFRGAEWMTPKQARALARALVKAAKELEAVK